MRVLIVGAGPAGSYLAYLLERRDPGIELRIVERNPPASTFGFGVVFSDRALEFLREDDEATYELIAPRMQRWHDMALHHRGERVVIDGVGFAAIGRLDLLRLLHRRLHAVNVEPEYRHLVDDARELDGYDLVVGADGLNSFVRRGREREFGTSLDHLRNRYVWYGTPRRFETLGQTFVSNRAGTFIAHHYRYAPEMSSFVVECDPLTWQRAGFADMDEAQAKAYCERVFADTLDGHPLVVNGSAWRRFTKLWNEHWHAGNRVLIGDALRTAHFSIGSGTRLAFEDAITLDRSLAEHADSIPDALAAFEAKRKPIVRKLVAAANASADWYEHFGEHMRHDSWDLAWHYIQRSGRVDLEWLRRVSPLFVQGYEQHAKGAA